MDEGDEEDLGSLTGLWSHKHHLEWSLVVMPEPTPTPMRRAPLQPLGVKAGKRTRAGMRATWA